MEKIKKGTLNQYVTNHNTCYLSGQRGKIIMPVIMDTFILRMCGTDSFLGEGGKFILIDKWSNPESIVQRPTHMMIGELKLNKAIHLTSEPVRSIKVGRNVGRQMLAGVI